jgi:hypothetical protein
MTRFEHLGWCEAYIEKQMGEDCVAEQLHRSLQPSLDLQLNYRPAFAGLNRRLTISLVTQSLLAGVDQLVHGSANLHGWGQTVRPNTSLLSVRGFDPTASQFKYTVNERFGATSVNTTAIRNPFQVGIQLRYSIGASGLAGLLGGGGFGGGAGGGGGRGGFGGGMGGGPGGPGGAAGAGGAGGFQLPVCHADSQPDQEMLELRIGLRLSDERKPG